MNFCTDYNFLNGLLIVKFFYRAALIILPIIIIIMGSIDGFKAVTSGKAEDLRAIIFNTGTRAASFFIILLLPTIIHIAFNFMDGYDGIYNNLTICMNNADPNVVAGLKRAREKELRDMEKSTTAYISKYNEAKYSKRTESLSGSNPAPQVSGSGNFVNYDLSESQLNDLAAICYREQGSAEGAAAEASLMANLFELKGGGHGSGAEGLYNYVMNSGWFGEDALHDTSSPGEDIVSVVRAVLVNGQRTLPGYIDEHDCIDCGSYGHDIIGASNNGVSFDPMDKSQYQSHTTVLNNKYGSTYTFYSFPTETSDPFGYTSEENRQRIGDDCYSFDQILG